MNAQTLLKLITLAFAAGAIAAPLAAFSAPEVPPRAQVVWVEEGPTIDGHLDDPVWRQALAIDELVQTEPIEGAPPSQRTVIYLVSDAENLYLGIRCFDSDPSAIVAQRMERDDLLFFDDYVAIALDTFHDRRNGFFFLINSLGARRDATFEGEIFEPDWDGIWFAKTQIDEQGWMAEIQIPYQTLSFDPQLDTWGFEFERGIRRNNEKDRWADPDRNRQFLNMSHAGILEGMRGISQGVGLDVKPYVSVRHIDDPLTDTEKTKVDPGLDLTYKFIPSLAGVLTINTDFGETEVDEVRINLARFALFFPEKRDFFLQDAGIFEFADLQDGGSRGNDSDTDANGRPFFSRRIGLSDDGEEVDILAGAKLTGRVGPFNLGFLDVQIDDQDGISSKNLAVGRVAMNLLGESKLGVIATHGDPNSRNDNSLVGTDFNYRDSSFLGNRVLEGNLWLQNSFTEGVDSEQLAYGARLAYPNDIVDWSLTARELQDKFNPALGFVNRIGIRRYEGKYRYRWRPEGLIRKIDTAVEGKLITNTTGRTESWRIRTRPIEVETEIQDRIILFYDHDFDAPRAAFSVRNDVFIPAGSYHFDRAAMRLETSQNRRLAGSLVIGGGEFYSGHTLTIKPMVSWRPNRHLLFELEYTHNPLWLDAQIEASDGTLGPIQDVHVITRIARARVDIAFTPDVSWNTLAQWDNVSDSLSVNSRLRWIVEDGREIFVVLNQGFETNDGSIQRGRTEPLVKVAWNFRF